MTGLRERNRQAAMREVQQVAVRLMRQASFDDVTVEQVAEAAGVSASTVYRYFGTKEALILWGDRPARLVETFASSEVGKRTTPGEAFAAAAIAVFATDGDDVLAQLRLVYDNDALAVAFEHQLFAVRPDVAATFADMRASKSPGARDDITAGAYLGALVAVLDRWQAGGGEKSLTKMLARINTSIAN